MALPLMGQAIDLVVVGGVAGAMTPAIAAMPCGLRVLLCDAPDPVGGTAVPSAPSRGPALVFGGRCGMDPATASLARKAHSMEAA